MKLSQAVSKLSERTTHSPLLFSLKVIDLGTPYLKLTVSTSSLLSGYSVVPSPCHPFILSLPDSPHPSAVRGGHAKKIMLSLSERRDSYTFTKDKRQFCLKKGFSISVGKRLSGFSPSIQLERERKCLRVRQRERERKRGREGSGQVHCGKSRLTERGAGSCGAEIGTSASRCQACQKLLLGSEKQQQDPAFL